MSIELNSTSTTNIKNNTMSDAEKLQLRKDRFQNTSLSIDTNKVNILG